MMKSTFYNLLFIIKIRLHQNRELNMRNGMPSNNTTYYNQFIDLKETIPLKSRHKIKNVNMDNIKIASKKLPPDFFRPNTREKIDISPIKQPLVQKQSGMCTPCFGNDKKQAASLSLIPKQKSPLEFHHHHYRISTLPVHESEISYKVQVRKNMTRQQPRDHTRKQEQQQYTYRHSNSHTSGNSNPNTSGKQRNSLLRVDHHHSTERQQKIKYKNNNQMSINKKLTLNDQLCLEEKKILNVEYENRIRLNVRKFFQEENQFINNNIISNPNIAYLNSNSAGISNGNPNNGGNGEDDYSPNNNISQIDISINPTNRINLQSIVATALNSGGNSKSGRRVNTVVGQLPYKLKVKKLPPLL